MSILTEEVLLDKLKSKFTAENDDDLKEIEDITETIKHFAKNGSVDVEQKLKENDDAWRKKFRDRFFDDRDDNNTNKNNNKNNNEDISFDDLFNARNHNI